MLSMVVRKEESQRRVRVLVAWNCLEGALMLRSVHGRTILFSARSSAARAYSSRPRQLRLVPFIVIAVLLFALIDFLKGQAALAQISPAQTYPSLTYPAQTYPTHTHRASHRAVLAGQKALALAQQQAPQKKYNEGRLMILGGYPGTTYFNLVHDIAAALAGSVFFLLIGLHPSSTIFPYPTLFR